jgi:hypothetical protein
MDRGAKGACPGEDHLAADRIAVVEVERAHEGLQRQPLDDERGQHDAECRDDDQIPVGKRGRAMGKRERRREGHDPAHPAPRNENAAWKQRRRLSRGGASRAHEPFDGGGGQQDPHDSNDDDCYDHCGGDEQVPRTLARRQRSEDRTDLQADEHERGNVEHEDRGFPNRVRRQPHARRRLTRCALRDGNGERDHRQHC